MKVVVVGGGVAGLYAAAALRELEPGADIVVLERGVRPGGRVATERTLDGYLLEHGPDSIATQRRGTMERIRGLGLTGEIVTGTDAPRREYVVVRGELRPIPTGFVSMAPPDPMSIFGSSLFSTAGKARMALEPFVAPGPPAGDESVGSFIRRRFGHELLERLVQPLLGGIHATPIDRLSMQAALPRLLELERRHGSVGLGLAIERRGAAGVAIPPPPGPPLTSFRRGMGTLVDALVARVPQLRTRCDVTAIARDGNGFVVRLADGARLHVDGAIVAAPAWAAAPMVEALDAGLAAKLGAIGHGPMTAVTLAFQKEDVAHPLDGTGFVVPEVEGRALAACTWSSRKLPGRAPAHAVLMRCYVAAPGGRDPGAFVEAARDELRDLLGIEAAPVLTRIDRRERALPRYEVGHLERVAALRRVTAELGAFALAGNAYDGLGLEDCMASGEAAARTVSARLAHRRIFVVPAAAAPAYARGAPS